MDMKQKHSDCVFVLHYHICSVFMKGGLDIKGVPLLCHFMIASDLFFAKIMFFTFCRDDSTMLALLIFELEGYFLQEELARYFALHDTNNYILYHKFKYSQHAKIIQTIDHARPCSYVRIFQLYIRILNINTRSTSTSSPQTSSH